MEEDRCSMIGPLDITVMLACNCASADVPWNSDRQTGLDACNSAEKAQGDCKLQATLGKICCGNDFHHNVAMS